MITCESQRVRHANDVRRHQRANARCSPRRAFTLVEMLVVLVVLLIVGLLGFTVVNSLTKSEVVHEGARNAQSFLEGARDRALHDKLPRGVRFYRASDDPTDTNYNMITKMVYIGPAGKLSTGRFTNNVVRIVNNGSNQPRRIQIVDTNYQQTWRTLTERGLITDGAWIKLRIGNSPPESYAIRVFGSGPYQYHLTKDFVGPINRNLTYELNLGAAELPNQEPRQLPGKVLIDPIASRFGNAQLTAAMPANRPYLDVMFSPRGTIVGSATQAGRIQLVVRGLADRDNGNALNDPDNEQPTLVVVITTQTGSVATHALSEPFNAADPAGLESD